MPSSLPQKKKQKQPSSTGNGAGGSSSLITTLTSLAALLPPSAPLNVDLNPLLTLISSFTSIPLRCSKEEHEVNRQATHTALHSLKATFEVLLKAGRVGGVGRLNKREVKKRKVEGKDGGESDLEQVRSWIGERYESYLKRLAEVAGGHWDARVRTSALTAHLALVRTESAFLTSLHKNHQAQFATSTYQHLVRNLLMPQTENGLLELEMVEEWKKYWDRYDDLRYKFMECSAAIITTLQQTSTPIPPQLSQNLVTILESLSTMPTVQSEINEFFCSTPLIIRPPSTSSSIGKKRKVEKETVDDGSTGIFDDSSSEDEEFGTATPLTSKTKKSLPPLLSLSSHRKIFQSFILSLLSLPLSPSTSKRLLVILHRQILPHLPDPKRLMDWLVDNLDLGGIEGVLALNGLFTLITKHNLDYPSFYTQLYALLDDNTLLHVKYRPRFFRLLETFLGSTHISVGVVASFLKRLSRKALSSTPAAIVMTIPFCYNLLKSHVGCMKMIHRPLKEEDENATYVDPYNPNEPDPLKTFALDSSLWELASLSAHYQSSIAGLSKILKEPMNKQAYAMEDFLDHSYSTMFETERTRVIRNAPALADVPSRQPIGDDFFPARVSKEKAKEGEEEVREPVDVVSRLWNMG